MGDFARVFKDLRTQNKLTQQEMANELNISRSSIGMYETGEREPNFELLVKIADYFNVDTNYLLGITKTTATNTTEPPLDHQTKELAQAVHENPDLKTLIEMIRQIPPERLQLYIDTMKKMLEMGDEKK